MKDHAVVEFEASDKTLSLSYLELSYGAVLYGERLAMTSNEILLHPGSTLNLTGGGHGHEEGLGHGTQVLGLIDLH